MKIYRLKRFSQVTEQVREEYITVPGDISNLPEIVQRYYKVGLNKDFLELINLQGCHEYNPFPVPIIDDKVDKEGLSPIFAENQDSGDMGSFSIYHKDGELYKRSGIFFKKFSPMSNLEFKNFLLNSIEEDRVGQEWVSHPNGRKIIALEEKIKSKIEKL